MIRRPQQLSRLRSLLKDNPVVAILGARQVGKTTLAKDLQKQWKQPCHAFDLERQRDIARLAAPELALEPLKGLVVLDEIQRMPDLFPLLRVLADRRPIRTRFLVLGSASPEMLRQGNETLGRTHRVSRTRRILFGRSGDQEPFEALASWRLPAFFLGVVKLKKPGLA